MKAFLFALIAVLAIGAQSQSTHSYSSFPPSLPTHNLADATIFALGPTGYGGKTSQEELQFQAMFVLDRESAKKELERLYSSNNPQAMSYALVGMRKLDKNRYSELLVSARTSHLIVTTMSGCLVEDVKLSKLANDLDSGKYDPWLRWTEKLPK